MNPSVRLAAAHRPLIRFLGKRSWPSTSNVQHAHPAAPEELKKSFGEFLKKIPVPHEDEQRQVWFWRTRLPRVLGSTFQILEQSGENDLRRGN